MILGDLLSELRENILRDVSDQVAGASDYLWSDATLVRYIDEAQRRFAQRSLCLRDGLTPQVCNITTVAGQTQYTLDKSVIAVMSVRMAGDNADLARAGHSQFDTYRTPDTYYFDPSQLSNLPPGKAMAFSTDETMTSDDHGSWRTTVLRLYPVISTAYAGIVGTMRVVRLPIYPLQLTDLTAYPEIPEEHHLDMLDWAAYLALRGADLDVAGGDARGRAKDFASSFEQHCKDAKDQLKQKAFTPVTWAFGLNGFSWTSI